MVTMPDSQGKKIVVMMVTRVNPVRITEAFQVSARALDVDSASTEAYASHDDAAAKGIANALMSAANQQTGLPAATEPFSTKQYSDNTG